MNEKIKYIKNELGQIVGLEVSEKLNLKELESAYPRKLYPNQWAKLDKGKPVEIITPPQNPQSFSGISK